MRPDASRSTFLIRAAVLWTCIVFAVAVPWAVWGDHDADDPAWRRAVLAACEPTWDPTDWRIVTHDFRTLHGEPADVGGTFWRVWQLPFLATAGQPTQAELDVGIHLRRWRWEYECLHPPPAAAGDRAGDRGRDSGTRATGSQGTTAGATVTPPRASGCAASRADTRRCQNAKWRQACDRFFDYQRPAHGQYADGGNEYLRRDVLYPNHLGGPDHAPTSPPAREECQRRAA